MAEKKLYTREEFEERRLEAAQEMAADDALRQDALRVLTNADQHMWVHQANWMGEPLLNLPQDMFAIQEIIFRTRPQYVIECGVAWGGGLLFCATLMQVLGGTKVIGIDTYIPDDLKQRIQSSPATRRLDGSGDMIQLVEGSSIDGDTIAQLETELNGCTDVLVILDSHHSHQHVLSELTLYSHFVGPGHYMVCGDTVVELIPEQVHRDRPWGPGDNPMTALNEFLARNEAWTIDEQLENKLLFTCNPRGYLRRIGSE